MPCQVPPEFDSMEKGEIQARGVAFEEVISRSSDQGNFSNLETSVSGNLQEPQFQDLTAENHFASDTRVGTTQFTKRHAGGFKAIRGALASFQSWIHVPSQLTTKPRTSIVRKLDQCPEGYPRLAALLDCDENFTLYRRFGFLQTRLLLNKQDELRELEKDLDRMDKVDEKHQPKCLKSREKDDANNGLRKMLLSNIEKTFKEYAQLLAAARDVASFNRPSKRDYLSVKSYFDEEAPLCSNESYIYCKEDIITLKPGRENAWLDAIIERSLQNISCKFVRYLFCSPELLQKTNSKDTGIILFSRARIDVAVSVIITATIMTLLIVPVYVLWFLTRSIQNGKTIAVIIAVLLVFTLVFSGTLTLFTRAKRHEILAAAAAYGAVLVVFIGNVGQINPAT